MERLPRVLFFILGDAKSIFRRLAESRLIVNTGRRAADVAQHEPERSPDRRVGAPTLSEDIARIVNLQRVSTWTVDNYQRRHVASGCLDTVKVEARLQYAPHGSYHQRKIVRQTTGHHGVGGDSFNRGDSIDRGNDTQQDRKSTRLNSSHLGISYAVFCLK